MNCDLRVASHTGNPVPLAGVAGKNDLVNAVFLNPNVRGLDCSRRAVFLGQRGSDIETVGENFLELGGQ